MRHEAQNAQRSKAPPIDWLRARYRYDPDSGTVSGASGEPVGSKGPGGALTTQTRYNGERFTMLVHRLAFALHKGRWPTGRLRHRDGDKANNRWANLSEHPATSIGTGRHRPYPTGTGFNVVFRKPCGCRTSRHFSDRRTALRFSRSLNERDTRKRA